MWAPIGFIPWENKVENSFTSFNMEFKLSGCLVDCFISPIPFVAFLLHVVDGHIVDATSETGLEIRRDPCLAP